MGEATNIYPHLNDQQKFRLNRINESKDYFVGENRERELMSKKLVNTLLLMAILIIL